MSASLSLSYLSVDRKIAEGTKGFKPSNRVEDGYWLYAMTKPVVVSGSDIAVEGKHYGSGVAVDEVNVMALVDIDRTLRQRFDGDGIVKAINYAADLWQRGLTDAANKVATGKKAQDEACKAWMDAMDMDTFQAIKASGKSMSEYFTANVWKQVSE